MFEYQIRPMPDLHCARHPPVPKKLQFFFPASLLSSVDKLLSLFTGEVAGGWGMWVGWTKGRRAPVPFVRSTRVAYQAKCIVLVLHGNRILLAYS